MATVTPAAASASDAPAPKPSTAGIARAAGLTVILVLLSRITGVLRDTALAYQFGRGDTVTIFRAAFGVPDIISLILAGGVMSSVFVPIFTRYVSEDKEEDAWRAFGSIISIVAVVVAVVVVGMELFVVPLTRLLNPKFSPEGVLETARYTRILLPVQWLLLVGGLMMGTLYARKRFLVPGLGPVLYNVGQIVGCVFFGAKYGLSAVAWGAVGGAFCGSILLPVWDMIRGGVRWYPGFDLRHPGVQTMGKLMGTAVLGLSLSQLNMWLTARVLPDDDRLAALTNAYNVTQMPIGVFAQAFAIALLPTISVMAGKKDWEGYRTAVSDGLRRVFFLTIPASTILCALAYPVIRLLFVGGKFTETDVPMAANALVGYGVATFAWSGSAILARGFHAVQDTRTAVLVTTPMVVLFFVSAQFYTKWNPDGYIGLALITSLCGIIAMGSLLALLHRKTKGGLDLPGIAASTAKITATSLVVGAGAWFANQALEPFLPGGKGGALIALLVVGGGACVAYAVLCYLLRVPELWTIREMFRKPRVPTGATDEPGAVS
ncbi:MAG: murein biosynthesis integral membrane protein MurJ [Fibrella sp.]|nr:murein biosynthesis integral membrane protein MurJ [Armatimonadota bacterium]